MAPSVDDPLSGGERESVNLMDILADYIQRHGDCNVPLNYHPDLGLWVRFLRKLHSRDELDQVIVDRLESIGFEWEETTAVQSSPTSAAANSEKKWEETFARLVAYKQKHGNCNVPPRYKEDKSLASWVAAQRTAYKHLQMPMEERRYRISAERVAKLNSIGFEWVIRSYCRSWDENYALLVEYKEEHGHCRVPRSKSIHDKTIKALGGWVSKQRHAYKQRSLPSGRRERQLSDDQVEKLEALGFEWEVGMPSPLLNRTWDDNYEQLVAYKKKHGNCYVAREHDDHLFVAWVDMQRSAMKQLRLPAAERTTRISEERAERLRSIGLETEKRKSKTAAAKSSTKRTAPSSWDSYYDMLAEYEVENGDCNVPDTHPNKKLVSWISNQREAYKQQLQQLSSPGESKQRLSISEAKVKKLNSLGFDWQLPPSTPPPPPSDSRRTWEDNFAILMAFRAQNGNCNVPHAYEDRTLAYWVSRQRQAYKQLQLPVEERKLQITQERVGKLQSVGFEWEARYCTGGGISKRSWDDNFARLVEYKEKHGNCNVPQGNKYDKVLASWIMNQRSAYKQLKLPLQNRRRFITEEAVAKLNSIGFRWEAGVTPTVSATRRSWDENYNLLAEYARENGDCNVPYSYFDKTLSNWCDSQRRAYKQLQLPMSKRDRHISEASIAKLDDIGFEWEVAPRKRTSSVSSAQSNGSSTKKRRR